MRLSVILLGVSLLGVLGGGWLTGRLGFGLCVIFDSLAVGAWALFHDDEAAPTAQSTHAIPGQPVTVAEVFERARRAS